MSCRKCSLLVDDACRLRCTICKKTYHYFCEDMPEDVYENLSYIRKYFWYCQRCDMACSGLLVPAAFPSLNPPRSYDMRGPTTTPDEGNGSGSPEDEREDSSSDEATDTSSSDEASETDTSDSELTESSDDEARVVRLTLESRIDVWSNKVDEYYIRMSAIEERVVQLEAEWAALDRIHESMSGLKYMMSQIEASYNRQEQHQRLKNIEIQGLPEMPQENLIGVVQLIAYIVGFIVQADAIEFATRIRLAEKPENSGFVKPVIVKFVSQEYKNMLMAAVKQRRGVTTMDLGYPGDARQVFLNEHLTPANKALLRRARLLCKMHNFKYCWTKNGEIYVQKKDGSPTLAITSEADLKKIK
ncbi:hypothetical protein JYU34_000287 [Plutella xylostella]|uniref:FP protein C-terminal domain-containing protein n=1 Tax=Plutella xylostella TaxID=51655 RepID=A0ABQ7R7B4_PLUXY|nr:hypothetical protein JYU34_000287 [Plutella xylostella]